MCTNNTLHYRHPRVSTACVTSVYNNSCVSKLKGVVNNCFSIFMCL